MRHRTLILAGLAAMISACAATIDPARIAHPDFARQANTEWTGLQVERRTAVDAAVTWNIWRIVNREHPHGPLWVVPHDNENAAFAAGLVAVKRWGGVLVAVDSGRDDTSDAARYVLADNGDRLDPNRTFTDDYPHYVRAMLADLKTRKRPIVALHTNAAGFDASLSTCGGSRASDDAGSGGISIRLCSDTYTPRPAPDRSWPWDDDDSVVTAPHLASSAIGDGWCQQQLIRGNFNISFEKVGVSDGSLSNYATLRGLDYLNFETRDLGSDAAAIATAGARLTAMVDAAMEHCLKPDTRLLATDRGGKEGR